MAVFSKGYTFAVTEQVTNAKLHTLVDNATLSALVNADISSEASIDESKINFDGSTVCKLGTTQTVTGNKTFSTLTNIYNMIGSLASINTISAVNLTGNLNSTNLMVGSMASLSYVRNTQINTNLICASLASIGSLTVGTLSAQSGVSGRTLQVVQKESLAKIDIPSTLGNLFTQAVTATSGSTFIVSFKGWLTNMEPEHVCYIQLKVDSTSYSASKIEKYTRADVEDYDKDPLAFTFVVTGLSAGSRTFIIEGASTSNKFDLYDSVMVIQEIGA